MLIDREMSSASCSSVSGARVPVEAPGCGRLAIGQRQKSIVGLHCVRHVEVKNKEHCNKSIVGLNCVEYFKNAEGPALFGSEGNKMMRCFTVHSVSK